MSKNILFKFLTLILTIFSFIACSRVHSGEPIKRPIIMASTSIIADAIDTVGGEFVETRTIVGRGADPHAYKISENDVITLSESDIIVYNGLLLEGRLERALVKVSASIPTIVLGSGIPQAELISQKWASERYNPHFWLDVNLWKKAVSYMTDKLSAITPREEIVYRKNEEQYLLNLTELDKYIKKQVAKVPEDKRFIITNHDSFDYFGRAYGFKTASLKGSDNKGELSSGEVRSLAEYIMKNKIKIVFTEYNAPLSNMKVLQSALEDDGYEIKIGGVLYSDTLGSGDNQMKSYIDMMTYNIDTIVQALK